MNAFRSRLPLVFVPLLALVTSAGAQWKNVAPNLIQGIQDYGAAIQFRDGIVWAGAGKLWNSTDFGKTWQQIKSFPISNIRDISFFDRLHGIVSTDATGFAFTSDGGKTWVSEFPKDHVWKVGYDGSASLLLALNTDGVLYVSNDGGNSWNARNVSNGTTRSFGVGGNHTIYVQSSNLYTSPSGSVLSSNDLGNTWKSGPASFEEDCYSMSVDSCDPNRLYVINEEAIVPTDSISKFLLSTDGGQTWSATESRHQPYLAGAMYTTTDGIFIGTMNGSGILRSMDRGASWVSIGGPSLTSDTRNICAINDNYILAIDPNGSIWLTTNGGGDSVSYTGPFDGTVAFSADSLFQGDTLRCDSATLPLYVFDSGCHPPLPQQYRITGPDSASFRVIDQAEDSIAVEFIPGHSGAMNATLVATLADGSESSIALAGFSAPPQSLAFNATSLNMKTDTIGGDVWVPIQVDGLSRPEAVELVLHYPLADLAYDGSFDRAGKQVDIPGEVWLGRSKLRIVDDTPGTVAAYAHFNVFSDTNYHPQVTFDSVTIPTALSPCSYSLPPAATATIYPLEGCGDQMLSQWFHLGKVPLLRVQPNPSNGDISIVSAQDMGIATIEVMDALGTVRDRFALSLSRSVPSPLSLPLESGVYYLRIISGFAEESVPIVIAK